MTDKTLQKHEKAITALEGKLEQLHTTVEQLSHKVSESQTQTSLRVGELVVQVSHLTAASEEFMEGMGEIMKFVNKEKPPDLEKDGYTPIDGKSPQTPINFAANNSVLIEDSGSVNPHNLNTIPE